MTDPSDAKPVELGKASPRGPDADPTSDVPFDPYRYGRPDHPIPPEYAPPGYVPDPTPLTPYDVAPVAPNARPTYRQQPSPTPYAGPSYPDSSYRGAPVPPPYHGYAQPRTGNGKAIAALVLGLLSIVLCWLPVFDALFVVLAVVFGLLARTDAKRGAGGGGMAIAGLACAVVGALLATLLTVKVISAVNKCGGFAHTGTSDNDFRQCVQDRF